MNTFFQRALPHLIALVIFLLACAAFFKPQLEGKVPQQGDIIQYRGMSQEAREFEARTGDKTLWTNAMFSGMPTYQINTVSEGNNLKILDRFARLTIQPPIGRFFLAMLGFYVLMVLLGVNHWLAVVGAIAFGFSTNNFILFEAGHETKLKSISYLPLVTAGMILAFRRRYLLGGLVFALGLGLNLMANHVQMTYYFFLTLAIFGIAELVYAIQRGELPHFAKASGALLVGGLLAIGSTASNLWITYEYSKDTMRGEPILKTEGEPSSSSETEGLEWDYAMSWSNNGIDLFASFIPGVAGGGSQEPVGPKSAVVQDLRQKGLRIPDEFAAPLYWGNLPFTSGPIYFGTVMFFFFIMGLFLVKGPVKWWIGLGALLTFLLSMGNNFEAFNRFFFDYVPLYNKFRTPNSVLSITAFFVPALAILALHKVAGEKVSKKAALRSLYIAGGITGATCLFFAVLGPTVFDFTSPEDARYQEAGYDVGAIISDRKALMTSDAFRALLLIALSGGLVWAHLTDKLKLSFMIAGLGILVLFDQWSVGRRYLNDDIFVSPSQYNANFKPREADEQILQDKDPNFRVYDATIPTFNSAKASYFHKTIGGYHAAKLQRYQDIIDRYLTQGNQRVLNMLNTRYFILPGPEDKGVVRRNEGALGNAWFVDTIRMVQTANEEIDELADIDPAREAVIHTDFGEYVSNLPAGGQGSISLSSYEPNRLTYQSTSPSEQLAVFSEVWYGPEKGWQAYIDGQPVEHIRANYILRALRIPAGEHSIEFRFAPKSFEQGKLASQLFSSVILLGLIGFVGYRGYQFYQNQPEKPAPESPEKPAGKKAKPAPSRRRKNKK